MVMAVATERQKPFEDGIRRWRDVDVAEWLGYEQPRDIRKLILRSIVELERHGICATVAQIHEGAGRPGEEFWLNFEQAMVICTLSRTPRAEDVRTAMIRVFSAVRQGLLEPIDGQMVRFVNSVRQLTDFFQ